MLSNAYYSLKGPKKFRKYSDKLCDLQSRLNFTENKIAAVIPKVCDILRQGLNKRILFLDVIKSSTQSVSFFFTSVVQYLSLSIQC